LTSADPGPPWAPAGDAAYSRRWLILAVVGAAQLMVALDTTVVNIALPFGASPLSNAVAFWTGGGISAAGAVVCGLLLRGRTAQVLAAHEPVPAHRWSLGGRRHRVAIGLSHTQLPEQSTAQISRTTKEVVQR
jgi:hypothetical protein